MNRRGLVAIVLVAAAIGVAIWLWRRRGDDRDGARTAAGSKPAPSRQTAPGQSPRGGSAPDDAHRAPDAAAGGRPEEEPPDPLVNAPAIQARMAEIHDHLQEAASPCFALVPTTLSADAQFRFRYDIAYDGGEARLSGFQLVWSDLGVAAADECLLDKLAAARWPVGDPDWSTRSEDSLTVAEMR